MFFQSQQRSAETGMVSYTSAYLLAITDRFVETFLCLLWMWSHFLLIPQIWFSGVFGVKGVLHIERNRNMESVCQISGRDGGSGDMFIQ